MTNFAPEQKHPVNIQIDMKQRQVQIEWADGASTVYPLDYLRKICPCAVCNEQRSDDDPLKILSPDQAVASGDLLAGKPAEMVGNYAIQFNWVDGHRTGIYTFEFLRRNAPK